MDCRSLGPKAWERAKAKHTQAVMRVGRRLKAVTASPWGEARPMMMLVIFLAV